MTHKSTSFWGYVADWIMKPEVGSEKFWQINFCRTVTGLGY